MRQLVTAPGEIGRDGASGAGRNRGTAAGFFCLNVTRASGVGAA